MISKLLQAIEARWQQYSQRERGLLMALVAICVLLLWLYGILLPGQTFAARADRGAVVAAKENANVRTYALELLTLREVSERHGGDPANLLRSVSDTAQAEGLMLTSTNVSDNKMVLVLRGPSSGAVLRWARRLPALTGARVSSLALEPAPEGLSGVAADVEIEWAVKAG
jgi:type II secretory pathway component PulM